MSIVHGCALALLALQAGGGAAKQVENPAKTGPEHAPAGMVWIAGGEFAMGSPRGEGQRDEWPQHRVRVGGFFIDATEVTNAQFREFVKATNYVTTAERVPDLAELMKQLPAGTPEPPKETLVPGSLVFDVRADGGWWWKWQPAACWHRTDGEHELSARFDEHPVVHVSWDDAVAYAAWARKRLPTEAEWEFAARGGLAAQTYVWGAEKNPDGKQLANIWQGQFPIENSKADGFAATAPVRSFAPNGYGLYDMSGNVWEWCADWYRADWYAAPEASEPDTAGPKASLDPAEPNVPKRVSRGGSFLCSDSYCIGYRPSARMKSSPDTSLVHTGFRCVVTPRMLEQRPAGK